MFKPRTLVLFAALLVSLAAASRPLGYKVPVNGGPIFKSDQDIFAFAAAHEILKFVPPRMAVKGMPPNVVPTDPLALKGLSRIETISHGSLGKLQFVYLPMWCGHRDATDHIAYVLKVVPTGRQLIGRVEYESSCKVSAQRPYQIVCDSYHGAKGSTIQVWQGKSFQWAPVAR